VANSLEGLEGVLTLLSPLKLLVRQEKDNNGGYILHELLPTGDFTVQHAGNYDALVFSWDRRILYIEQIPTSQRFLVAGDHVQFEPEQIKTTIYKCIESGVFRGADGGDVPSEAATGSGGVGVRDVEGAESV
jgi:hypothetical protein